MQKTIKFVMLLSAFLFVSGCAAIDIKRPVEKSALTKINKIGVASKFEDDFNLTLIGLTVFNNKFSKLDVSEWNIPKRSIQVAMNQLNSTGKYTTASLGSGFEDNEGVFAAAEKQGVDTVVLIKPTRNENYSFFSPGYGLFRRGALGSYRECIYTLMTVEAYDVKSRSKHGWEWGHDGWSKGILCYGKDGNGVMWPFKDGWRETKGEFSAQELDILRQNVVASLEGSIALALKGLALSSE